MSSFYFYEGRKWLFALRDVFGRRLEEGDYVIVDFQTRKYVEDSSVGIKSFFALPILRLADGRVHCYSYVDDYDYVNARPFHFWYFKERNAAVGYAHVFKLDREEAEAIISNAKAEDYSSYKVIKEQELFNREVKAGDLVVYSRDIAIFSEKTAYGIVVGKNKVFNGEKITKVSYYCLIDRKDEAQKKIHEELQKNYIEFSVSKEKSKQEKQKRLDNGLEIGDTFGSDKYYYICIDKIKKNGRYKYCYLKRSKKRKVSTVERISVNDISALYEMRLAGLECSIVNRHDGTEYLGRAEVNINNLKAIYKFADFIKIKRKEYLEKKRAYGWIGIGSYLAEIDNYYENVSRDII